jgi:hypothetical protein
VSQKVQKVQKVIQKVAAMPRCAEAFIAQGCSANYSAKPSLQFRSLQ